MNLVQVENTPRWLKFSIFNRIACRQRMFCALNASGWSLSMSNTAMAYPVRLHTGGTGSDWGGATLKDPSNSGPSCTRPVYIAAPQTPREASAWCSLHATAAISALSSISPIGQRMDGFDRCDICRPWMPRAMCRYADGQPGGASRCARWRLPCPRPRRCKSPQHRVSGYGFPAHSTG